MEFNKEYVIATRYRVLKFERYTASLSRYQVSNQSAFRNQILELIFVLTPFSFSISFSFRSYFNFSFSFSNENIPAVRGAQSTTTRKTGNSSK